MSPDTIEHERVSTLSNSPKDFTHSNKEGI